MIAKTLDDTLRARGLEKLTREISAVIEPVMKYLRLGHGLTVKDVHGNRIYMGEQGKEIPNNAHALEAHEVLSMLKDTIIANRRDKAEQKEVDDFIVAVGKLQNSVAELCSGLPE